MSDKQKKESARRLSARLDSWDPSEPCVFELSADKGEYRLGPLSCVMVKERLCFFAQGSNITDMVSDLLGLGLRGAPSDGVPYQTYTGRPEKEAMEWALEQARALAPEEASAGKLRVLSLLIPLIGSRPRDLLDLGPLAQAIESVGGEPSRWGLNWQSFERALIERAPDCALSFFNHRSSAEPSTLSYLIAHCSDSTWRARPHTRDLIALRLWDLGSRAPLISGGAAPIQALKALPEDAEAGGLIAQLEALELREHVKPGGRQGAKASLAL